MKIALIPNPKKPQALAAAQEAQKLLANRAETVLLADPEHDALQEAQLDLVVVFGGDGSILRLAHAMPGITAPVVGINFGKLGYLAAFSMQEFKQHLDTILAGGAPITERLMLEGSIFMNGHIDPTASEPLRLLQDNTPRCQYVALNDIVINAGPPFKMIDLHIRVDEQESTTFRSDGIILSTASGSTGYNLAAGGPILTPGVHAMILTPICAHSLSFRPVVLGADSGVMIHPQRVNPGTCVSFDGQIVEPLHQHEYVIIRRAPDPLRLVENPAMNHWRMLSRKLHWAQSPRSNIT